MRLRRRAPAVEPSVTLGCAPEATAREIIAQASDAIIATDTQDRIVVWNAAAERLLGWSAAEVIGGPIRTLPPDEAVERQQVLARVREGESFSLVTRRRTKTGRDVEVLIDYSPMYSAEGTFTGAIGVLRDVTAQRAADRARESRAELIGRLHAVIADLATDRELDSVLRRITDSCVELLDASGAGYALLEGDTLRITAISGLSAQLVGLTFPIAESAVQKLLGTGEPSIVADADAYPNTSHEIRRHIVDLHTLAVAQTVVNGEVSGALYVFFAEPGREVTPDQLDVLELLAGHAGAAIANAHAYAEVVRQREHEQAIIDAMADGMAVIDDAGNVLEWNPAAEAMTGLGIEQVLGKQLPFPVADGGTVVDHELPSGRWIEVICTRIAGSGERVVDFRDITAPKALEQAKDLFLATTSHELRTPITVMKGFASTLLHRWDSLGDDERRDAVAVIMQRTDALASLVEQILLTSRAGAGKMSLSRTPLDIASMLREAAATFDAVSSEHRIVCTVGALPLVIGDPIAVDNIVAQLLENAVKYSPDGGMITVRARQDGDEVAVTVEDTGVGITAEDTERVFDRFVQGDPGMTRRFGGVGLGLYIVRQLVEAQGGRVSALPRPVGACVEFRLPVAEVLREQVS